MEQKNFGTILNPVMEHLLLGNFRDPHIVNFVVVTDEGMYDVKADGTVLNGPMDLDAFGDPDVGTYLTVDMGANFGEPATDEELETIYEFFGVEEPDFIDDDEVFYFKFQEEE